MSKRSRRKHSSVRDLFDAGDDLAPNPFDGLDIDEASESGFGDDEDGIEGGMDGGIDEDAAPRVILGTVESLGTRASEAVARLAERPIWFLLDEHESMVGVFERYPEEPLPNDTTSAVLGCLRAFSTASETELQSLLGPTDRLRFGFHTSASLEEVVESFEDDGFDVLLGLSDGRVEMPPEG